jgi:hypothetical protein
MTPSDQRPAPSAGWQPLSRPGGLGGLGGGAGGGFTTAAFTRLARVHALSTAVDTLVATSLAGSLFFSIPTGEARGRVALYLLLTIAPFAVVGPVMGPALDRMKGGRRLLVIGTGVARIAVCLLMSRQLDSLLLFPLAFVILVLGKAYAIARAALVPTVVPDDAGLVEANAKLSLLSGVCGFVAAAPGALILTVFGASWVLLLAAVVAAGQAIAALALPRVQVAVDPPGAAEEAELRSEGVVLASEAMGLLRGSVGFLTFLLAFALRGGGDDTPVPVGLALGRAVRDAAGFELAPSVGTASSPTWHFGVVLGASLLGSLSGALLAPRLRDSMSEERILQGALIGTGAAAVLAAGLGGVTGAAVAALGLGTGSSAGKLAFDSIVQRDAPDANRGRSFANFETRFQLLWVVGGFIPVVVALPARIGFLVVAGAAGFALFSYLAGLRTHGHRPPRRGPFGTPAAEAVLVGPPDRGEPPPMPPSSIPPPSPPPDPAEPPF